MSASKDNDSSSNPSAPSVSAADGTDSDSECPFCTYMRSGGCGTQFDAFMECGAQAETGAVEYHDCYAQFEALKTCMQQNSDAYTHMLDEMSERQLGAPSTATAGQQQGNADGQQSSDAPDANSLASAEPASTDGAPQPAEKDADSGNVHAAVHTSAHLHQQAAAS